MIILDTNVVSALHTTSVTQAEILYGIALLPVGKRREALAAIAEAVFAEDFAGRVLAFDSAAAERFAAIVVAHRQAGNPIENFDAQIAAIAAAAGATVATRDTDGFAGRGLSVVDPWQTA